MYFRKRAANATSPSSMEGASASATRVTIVGNEASVGARYFFLFYHKIYILFSLASHPLFSGLFLGCGRR